MGCTLKFRCPGCGYTARVSGGPDGGEVIGTETISCENCRKLYDVVSGYHGSPLQAPKEVPLRCPRSARHTFQIWTYPGSCPKCDGEMEKLEEIRLWD